MNSLTLAGKDRSLAWLIHILLRCMALTWRYKYTGQENILAAASAVASGSYAQVLWHENILATLAVMFGTRMAPLASHSKDGAIVTMVMESMGYRTIRGSSSKGGPEARDELVEITGEGYLPTLTPDGPRGPRRKLKSGIIDSARRSGVSIIPFAPVADRSWVLHKSWDHFQIPKPFATIHVVFGAPVHVPTDTSGSAFGAKRAQLQSALDAAQAQSEALAGRSR